MRGGWEERLDVVLSIDLVVTSKIMVDVMAYVN